MFPIRAKMALIDQLPRSGALFTASISLPKSGTTTSGSFRAESVYAVIICVAARIVNSFKMFLLNFNINGDQIIMSSRDHKFFDSSMEFDSYSTVFTFFSLFQQFSSKCTRPWNPILAQIEHSFFSTVRFSGFLGSTAFCSSSFFTFRLKRGSGFSLIHYS